MNRWDGFRPSTPVAFIIFNRPDTTARVFEAIRQAQPPHLFVIADGPRPDHPSDDEKCAAARAIVEQINWDCAVQRNYAETNMGCKRRVSTGLNWVLDSVEEAIILEDDCLPDPTFFRFCQELLQYYRNDERIMAISGDNFQFGEQRTQYSYYFSRYPHCWGWATWRRAWQHYDGDMTLWPTVRDGDWLQAVLPEKQAMRYWTRIFDRTYRGEIDTWAYRWTYSCWIESGLTVLPNVNLVSNIGFGGDATHTGGSSRLANLPTQSMPWPLRHPEFALRDSRADSRTQAIAYGAHAKSGFKRFGGSVLRALGALQTYRAVLGRLREELT